VAVKITDAGPEKAGQSDAGVVWKTEVKRAGADMDAVELPEQPEERGRLRDRRAGPLAAHGSGRGVPRVSALTRWSGPYAKYGFVKATPSRYRSTSEH
jgi:hypothetical protein